MAQQQFQIGGEWDDPEEKGEGLTDIQALIEDALEKLATAFGKFDKTPGAQGAHYFDGSQNPFKGNGIKCKNCVMFDNGMCEIVDGNIDPSGICKFWVIPQHLINDATAKFRGVFFPKGE